jgi:predicted PurR-regulated permease PerM
MTAPIGPRDLPRIVIGVLFIALLGFGSLFVLKPFLPALVWATMIVVATWPLLKRVQRAAGGRRWIAVIVMMVALLVILIAPLAAALWTLASQAERLVALTHINLSIPGPPAWVAALPMGGEAIADEWQKIAAAGPEALAARFAPYMTEIGKWLAAQLGGLGGILLLLGLTVILCAVLYSTGEIAARGVRAFFRRLDGERGDQSVVLAGASIRAVALGIVVTALVQTVLGALGLLIAGVPYVAVLAALMFICCIVQIGPTLVLLGGVGWLWYTGDHGWAIALGVWTVLVASLDNILRPVLIKRGADLPFLLILAGVLGGLLTLGIVGLFVGPVVLAITYNLLQAWVAEGEPPTRKGA